MKAVILAGGSGTRLRSIERNTAKPMLPFFGRPVLEHTIRLLKKHGIRDIYIALSYKAKEVLDYFGDGSKLRVKINYSLEERPMGTAGGVKRLQPLLNETFLLISSDTITDIDLTEVVLNHKMGSAMATMVLRESEDPCEYGIAAVDERGFVTKFLEKPREKDIFSHKISTGIYVMEPDVLSQIPYETPCDFGSEVFPRMLRNMDPIRGLEIPGYWCDVGDPIRYRNAHFDALMGKLNVDIGGREIEEGVHVAKGAEIHSAARIAGPAYIGPNTEIRRNAIVGGLSVVGADVLVDEAAGISRSVIGNRAVIGRCARINNSVIADGHHIEDNEQAFNLIMFERSEEGVEEFTMAL